VLIPDEAAIRERVLRKNVEAPDLATVKDFLRFHAAASKGKIKEKIATDSLNTFALLLPAAQLWPRRSQAAVPKCEDQVLVGQVPKCPAALDKVLPCRCHNGTWQNRMASATVSFSPNGSLPDHISSILLWLVESFRAIPRRWILQPVVPVTFALLYIITTKACDTITSSRRGTPLIGKSSKAFNRLVLTHNLGLAAYSFWTFIGISAALKGSPWAAYFQNGWSGVSEAMCYIHSQQVLRDPNSLNDKTQATTTGALWDDGLGFYGFWFYVSKYYEVVDSLILFLKGKEISALQIYHHAGAILCVWAGIRYQAPPIWTFVFLNSAVHTLMVRLRAGMFASF
jgi:hypothetical protein